MTGNIDLSLIDWSRAQFALTAMYHWLFVPLTLGLAFIIAIMFIDLRFARITNYELRITKANQQSTINNQLSTKEAVAVPKLTIAISKQVFAVSKLTIAT